MSLHFRPGGIVLPDQNVKTVNYTFYGVTYTCLFGVCVLELSTIAVQDLKDTEAKILRSPPAARRECGSTEPPCKARLGRVCLPCPWPGAGCAGQLLMASSIVFLPAELPEGGQAGRGPRSRADPEGAAARSRRCPRARPGQLCPGAAAHSPQETHQRCPLHALHEGLSQGTSLW